MESIISEAKELVSRGVKEIVLVAQDTTKYGISLYGEYRLASLLKELCKIKDLRWIRLFFTAIRTKLLMNLLILLPRKRKYVLT